MQKFHKTNPYDLGFFNLIYWYNFSIMFTNEWLIYNFKLTCENGETGFVMPKNAFVLLFAFSLINPWIKTNKLDDGGVTVIQKDKAWSMCIKNNIFRRSFNHTDLHVIKWETLDLESWFGGCMVTQNWIGLEMRWL